MAVSGLRLSVCALWKQSFSSLAEKSARTVKIQSSFTSSLQSITHIITALIWLLQSLFCMGGTEIQWSTDSTLDSKPQLTAQHFWPKQNTLSKPQHCPGHSCTAATACHRGCGHDWGCFTAQSTWSLWGKSDINCPGNFRNGEKAFIVNFYCLGVAPNSTWRQIIALSRLRLDLTGKQLFDNENI